MASGKIEDGKVTWDRVSPEDAGCWIDGHHGQYATPMLCQLAIGQGMPMADADKMDVYAWLNQSRDVWAVTDDVIENVVELSDDALVWLNENIAPDGYAFGWHNGEFFLWSIAEWEESA